MSSSVAEFVPEKISAAGSIIYLGMDVHKESITIAVLPQDAKSPTRVDRLPNDLLKLKRLLDRIARDGEVRACYEASGAGYVLHRAMKEWGYQCDVIAPSLIPKRVGVQRKHDKYDAAELAGLHRAGQLIVVRIPTAAEERVRDVVRCRETFQREIMKSRHYILKFLARRMLAPAVRRLQCFRGISLHSAMVLATEIVDWRRFERPSQLSCYVGLVSREHSSGERERRGSITKAGNSHCRHVLIQAAWSYHHRPATGADLKRRQSGQPPGVIAHAWKAQQRLHQRYNHLAYRKAPQIAVVAVARELVGFLWSVMQDVEQNETQAA